MPLFSQSWPVTVERKLFPALAPEAAFLVAELKNPSGQAAARRPGPALRRRRSGGHRAAQAGRARRDLHAAARPRPRASSPCATSRSSPTEAGVISKDETTEYTVTIEVANPTRAPLRLRVVDQMPVTGQQDVTIKLERVWPELAARDEAVGKLEWRLLVPAAGKATVSFVYTLKRPKGYQLRQ